MKAMISTGAIHGKLSQAIKESKFFLWRCLSLNIWCSSRQNKIRWTLLHRSQSTEGCCGFTWRGCGCVPLKRTCKIWASCIHIHAGGGRGGGRKRKKKGEWRNMVDFRKNRLSIFPSWPGRVQNVWFYWPMPRAHFLGVIFVYIKEYISLSIL